MGLGEKRETLQFTFPATEPARGTAIPTIADQIKSEASATRCEIVVTALDDEIKQSGLPIPDFIKIDVEGMEYPALMGMRATLKAHHPRLSIEMHGADMEEKAANAGRVVPLLEEAGYHIRHIETGTEINSTNAASASQGHLYCEAKSAL
jgi:hypothetical protein